MDKIKNKLRLADTILPEPYWDVTRSGKVLELRVRPSIDRNPGNYRLGVIQIGRIISRIQTLATHTRSQPQIQLFPNLAENQLAATVYWPGFLEQLPENRPGEKSQPPLSTNKMKQLAEHYDLSLLQEKSVVSEDDDRLMFTIISKSNQPFIWLKVGQFIQDVTEHAPQSVATGNLTVEVLTSCAPQKGASSRIANYKQLNIFVSNQALTHD